MAGFSYRNTCYTAALDAGQAACRDMGAQLASIDKNTLNVASCQGVVVVSGGTVRYTLATSAQDAAPAAFVVQGTFPDCTLTGLGGGSLTDMSVVVMLVMGGVLAMGLGVISGQQR